MNIKDIKNLLLAIKDKYIIVIMNKLMLVIYLNLTQIEKYKFLTFCLNLNQVQRLIRKNKYKMKKNKVLEQLFQKKNIEKSDLNKKTIIKI